MASLTYHLPNESITEHLLANRVTHRKGDGCWVPAVWSSGADHGFGDGPVDRPDPTIGVADHGDGEPIFEKGA